MSAIVQRALGSCNNNGITTLPGNTTIGNLLIAMVSQRSGSPSPATPSGFTSLVGGFIIDGPGNTYMTSLAYKVVASPASVYTLGSSSIHVGTLWEISNATVSGATILSAGQQSGAADLGNLGDLAVGQVALCLIVRCAQGGQAFSAGSGWTAVGGSYHVSCNGAPWHCSQEAVGAKTALHAAATVTGNAFGPSNEYGGYAIKLVDTTPPAAKARFAGFIG